MNTLEIWLLAISLAMDCFTVSITSGIIMRRICRRTFFCNGILFRTLSGRYAPYWMVLCQPVQPFDKRL